MKKSVIFWSSVYNIYVFIEIFSVLKKKSCITQGYENVFVCYIFKTCSFPLFCGCIILMTILKLHTWISVIFNELPNYGDFDYKKKK